MIRKRPADPYQVSEAEMLRIERAQLPYLRVLVISGYLKGEQLEAARFIGATGVIEKPFTAEAMVNKVREMIGGAHEPGPKPPRKRAKPS